MLNGLIQFAADATIEEQVQLLEAGIWQTPTFKMIAAGLTLVTAAASLGMVGANYMKALGRNPEAGKAAGQIVIVAAMIEVTALLAFLVVLIG